MRLPTALGKEREARRILADAIALSVDEIRIAGADALEKVEQRLDAALEQAQKVLGEAAHRRPMAEYGARGGKTTAERYGSQHFVDAGRLGGRARKENIGTAGFAAMGRKGGAARRAARDEQGRAGA